MRKGKRAGPKPVPRPGRTAQTVIEKRPFFVRWAEAKKELVAADYNGNVVGRAGITFAEDPNPASKGPIAELRIDPASIPAEYRVLRGVGNFLLKHLLFQAKEAGATRAVIRVSGKSGIVEALYRMHFQPVKEVRRGSLTDYERLLVSQYAEVPHMKSVVFQRLIPKKRKGK